MKNDIYSLLEKDHKKVHYLLDRLVACSEAGKDEWKKLVDQIRDELIPHARAEEELFYNGIRERNPDAAGIGHAFTEHAMAETELRTLQAMKSIDVNWTRLARKLRDDLLHHVEEEESEVFALGKQSFTDQEAVEIGAAFEALKPKIKEESLMATTVDLVGNIFNRQRDRAAIDKTDSRR